jgi:hypothetical protein
VPGPAGPPGPPGTGGGGEPPAGAGYAHVTASAWDAPVATLPQAHVTNLPADLAAKVDTTDPRLTNARTPTAHAATHRQGGSDALKLDELGTPTDVTTLNANSTAHGLLPKLPDDPVKFLNGIGGWATPAGGSGGAPAAHALTHTGGGTDPLPYVDLPEAAPTTPPADHARLFALDVNTFTQVEMRDNAGRGVRFASDNVLIAKVTEPAGVARGRVVYIAGAQGANALVRLARANDITTMPGIGLALDAGVENAFIRVLVTGTLQQMDTSAFVEGVSLFVSPTTAGALTDVLPVAPNFAQRIGFVTRSHATAGETLVLTTGVAGPPRLHHATHEPGGTDALVNAAWTNLAALRNGKSLRRPRRTTGGRSSGEHLSRRADPSGMLHGAGVSVHGGGRSRSSETGSPSTRGRLGRRRRLVPVSERANHPHRARLV